MLCIWIDQMHLYKNVSTGICCNICWKLISELGKCDDSFCNIATDTLLMPTNCRLWHFFTAKYCLRLHFHYKCCIVVLPRCRAAQLCKTSIYFGPWTGENSLWSKWTPAGCRSACQWYSTKIQAEQEYQNCYFIICKSFLFYILVNIKLTYMFLDVLFAKNIFIF